jgi:3-oxoacyl-[acyl-carrier protein] reductase
MISLEGKAAIITGSGRGIGAEIAKTFAKLGASVVVSDVMEENVNEVVDEINNSGGKAVGIECDVTKASDVDAMVEKCTKEFGSLDIMVNNAGITKDTLCMKMSEEQWDAVINVNLKGVFLCGKAAYKVMMKQKSGCIINMASIVGIIGNVGQTNYSATKGGVIAMTKTWAKEFSKRNVRVNAIAPGFIRTEMTDKMPDDIKEKFKQNIPLARLGETEDIANAASFLASQAASYITGQVLVVDGGMVM